MRLLVTGGAGYIGGTFIRSALTAGHEITVLDNLSTGHRDAVPEPIRFVHGDIRQRDLMDTLLAESEAVVHFAALSIVSHSIADPLGYYRENLGGFLALMEAIADSPVRKLVFSSSAAVYGMGEGRPFKEDDPRRPVNPYGGTKLAIEETLEHVAPGLGLDYASLRYFNAAGALDDHGERHDPETHLIPLALEAAAKGGELKIFGQDYPTPDGTCIRDYIHVEDLALAHLKALDILGDGLRTALNLGTGSGFSVREVANCVKNVTGLPLKVSETTRREGDPALLVADVGKAWDLLAWRAEKLELSDIVQSAWNFLNPR
jgi:UDP-glucose 4-epimerase